MEKETFSSKETARYLCVSMSKLWKMTHRKQIKYYKVGRLNVFRREDLEAFLQRNEQPSIADLKDKAETTFLNSKPISHI
jgi:excisionase family DNA binding protein